MSTQTETLNLETIERLLQLVVALLLRRPVEQPLALKKQIETLNAMGLKPKEIAQILGRSSTYVSKELSGLRKKSKIER